MRRFAVCCVVGLAASGASAQAPFRFRFTPGDALTYAVEQTTAVTETTVEDGRPVVAQTVTKLTLVKRWDVKAVDAAGVATLDLVVTAMRQDIRRPGPPDKDGKPTTDTVVIDSADPAGRTQLAFLDKPVVTVRLTAAGGLVDATSATPAAADRLRAELPFRVDFTAAGTTPWARPFAVKLDPPLGTGEQYGLTQSYTPRGAANGLIVVGVTTAVDADPKDAADWPPLVPVLWAGDVSFDPAAGRYAGARLRVKREVANHAGPGSKLSYESTLVERAAAK